jgi:hypothetical protein
MTSAMLRWVAVAVIALITACGTNDTSDGANSSDATGDTERQNQWLTICAADADCGVGFTCLCGVCSVVCEAGDPCETAPDSVCVPSVSPAIERLCGGIDRPSGLCLPACAADADCADGQLCDGGACVPFACPEVDEPECPGLFDRAISVADEDGCEAYECVTECPGLPGIECAPGDVLQETVVDGCTLYECVDACSDVDVPECPPGEAPVRSVGEDGCETWTCASECADPGPVPVCETGTEPVLVTGDDGCEVWTCAPVCDDLGDPPVCIEGSDAIVVADERGCERWVCVDICDDPGPPLPCDDGADPVLTVDESGCEVWVCPPPADSSWARPCSLAADCGVDFVCICGMCSPADCEVGADCGPDAAGTCTFNGGHPGVDMACGDIDAPVSVCASDCATDAGCAEGMTCVDSLCVPTDRLVFECDTFTCDPATEHCQESLPGVPGPAWYECGAIPERCARLPRGDRCPCLIAESEFGPAMDCREDAFGFLRTRVAFP